MATAVYVTNRIVKRIVQVDRCAEITQAILKFGRKSRPVFQGMDLSEFIPEIIMMVGKKASVHGISIGTTFSIILPEFPEYYGSTQLWTNRSLR